LPHRRLGTKPTTKKWFAHHNYCYGWMSVWVAATHIRRASTFTKLPAARTDEPVCLPTAQRLTTINWLGPRLSTLHGALSVPNDVWVLAMMGKLPLPKSLHSESPSVAGNTDEGLRHYWRRDGVAAGAMPFETHCGCVRALATYAAPSPAMKPMQTAVSVQNRSREPKLDPRRGVVICTTAMSSISALLIRLQGSSGEVRKLLRRDCPRVGKPQAG
jgi:hypothetical protein